jgi:hypothetical protein
MADQAKGGLGNYPTSWCMPGGMPRMMAAARQEYVVTPETTYIITGVELRRIFTDGRDWPTDAVATYQGYSIGKWIDEDGDGQYDVLEVDTGGPFMGRAPMMPRGSRCISITSQPSRNAFTSTKAIQSFFMMKSPCSITR